MQVNKRKNLGGEGASLKPAASSVGNQSIVEGSEPRHGDNTLSGQPAVSGGTRGRRGGGWHARWDRRQAGASEPGIDRITHAVGREVPRRGESNIPTLRRVELSHPQESRTLPPSGESNSPTLRLGGCAIHAGADHAESGEESRQPSAGRGELAHTASGGGIEQNHPGQGRALSGVRWSTAVNSAIDYGLTPGANRK